MVLYKIFQSFDKVTVERVLHCAYSPVNKTNWAKRVRILEENQKILSWKDHKNRYCSYIFSRSNAKIKWKKKMKKTKLERYFAFCFSSNLIFKKLRNNREEEETLSSFNCENTQVTKLRWMEHYFQAEKNTQTHSVYITKLLKVLFSAFSSIFKCATAVLFIAQVSVSLFHIWTQFICRHLRFLYLAKFYISRHLKPL